jgi:hypothetical protein
LEKDLAEAKRLHTEHLCELEKRHQAEMNSILEEKKALREDLKEIRELNRDFRGWIRELTTSKGN